MNISTKGLIEIMSLEGVCLSPYLDSVGVWTIGVGITKYDGKDPQTMGTITIDQAITMFKDRIGAYEAAVRALKLNLSQTQFDALTSFCFNVGPGNLNSLCRNRSLEQIGEAFSLYHHPPEVTERRNKEQKLFKTGVYSANGKVLVFPVSASHKPQYGKGYQMDVSKYFTGTAAPTIHPHVPEPTKAPAATAKPSLANTVTIIINAIAGLFRR